MHPRIVLSAALYLVTRCPFNKAPFINASAIKYEEGNVVGPMEEDISKRKEF